MGRAERTALLRTVPALQSLTAEAVEHLAARVGVARFAADEQVIAEGELGDRAYVIAAGTAQALVAGQRGPVLFAAYS